MTKPALIVILVCALLGLFFGYKQKPQTLPSGEESKISDFRGVVYITKPIAAKGKVNADNAENRTVTKDKVPSDAVPAINLAAGHAVKNDIAAGQILRMSDLDIRPTGFIRIVNY